jgi:hypothetical protein
MSDERLLSEALRAHAAGGVSTPRADTSATTTGSPTTEGRSDGTQPSGRRRFRPLGRVRQPGRQSAEQPPVEQPRTDQPVPDRAPRTDVPTPRSGGPALPPPGYPRGPVFPAPPTAPVRQGPPSGGFGAADGQGPAGRPQAPHPTPPTTGASAGYVPWSAVTVTWWSLVAVLAGGVVGGAIGVLSLLLPA